MWLQNFLFFLIILIVKCNCEDVEDSYQLPNNSKPLSYELWLKVNMEEGLTQFTGHVKIHIKLLENSRVITLHSRNLLVKEINLFDRNKTLIHSELSFGYINSRDFLNINLPSEMLEGSEFVLDISYEGKLTKKDSPSYRGFSMGEYEENNKTLFYIFTHFEPFYARECLPCYDEPAIRAIFSVKIEHDSSYDALSNMPIKSRDKMSEARVVSTFHDTPTMQTYLLALFIHKFAITQTNDLIKPQRIFTRREFSDNQHIKFASENLDKILKAFEEYFDVPYTLPKLDHVVAPHFMSATENWGLIGYAEYYMTGESEILSLRVFFHEMSVS